MAHFPPMQLRPPHDLHYMHQHQIYQQYLRQSYHLPRLVARASTDDLCSNRSGVGFRSVTGGIEKPGEGQEGEEAPVTSPPLELRRPGSVGLALPGHSAAVPHTLQSPHDRTTGKRFPLKQHQPQLTQLLRCRFASGWASVQHAHRPHATLPLGPLLRASRAASGPPPADQPFVLSRSGQRQASGAPRPTGNSG